MRLLGIVRRVKLDLLQHLHTGVATGLLGQQTVDRFRAYAQVRLDQAGDFRGRRQHRQDAQPHGGADGIHRVQVQRVADRQHQRPVLHAQRKDGVAMDQLDRETGQQRRVHLRGAQIDQLDPHLLAGQPQRFLVVAGGERRFGGQGGRAEPGQNGPVPPPTSRGRREQPCPTTEWQLACNTSIHRSRSLKPVRQPSDRGTAVAGVSPFSYASSRLAGRQKLGRLRLCPDRVGAESQPTTKGNQPEGTGSPLAAGDRPVSPAIKSWYLQPAACQDALSTRRGRQSQGRTTVGYRFVSRLDVHPASAYSNFESR